MNWFTWYVIISAVVMFFLNMWALRFHRDITIFDILCMVFFNCIPFFNITIFYILGGFERIHINLSRYNRTVFKKYSS